MKRVISVFVLSLVPFVAAADRGSLRNDAIDESSAQWDGRWVADPSTGCRIWFDGAAAGDSIQWTGKCGSDGLASGPGTITYRKGGILSWRSELGADNGLEMDAGHEHVRIAAGALKIERDCPASGEIAFANVTVAENIDLGEPWIVRAILRETVRVLQRSCRLAPDQSFHIYMARKWERRPDDMINGGAEINWAGKIADINRDVTLNWRPTSERVQKIQAERQAEMAARQNADQRHRDQQAAEAATRVVRDQQKKRDAIVSKYGVSDFPTIDALNKNAFRFEGKTIAFRGKFRRMLSADKGVFEDLIGTKVIVSGLPSTLFDGSSDGSVIIVGKGLGTTNVGIVLPHVRYIANVPCELLDCSDRGLPR